MSWLRADSFRGTPGAAGGAEGPLCSGGRDPALRRKLTNAAPMVVGLRNFAAGRAGGDLEAAPTKALQPTKFDLAKGRSERKRKKRRTPATERGLVQSIVSRETGDVVRGVLEFR
jgi:hypothetical protein